LAGCAVEKIPVVKMLFWPPVMVRLAALIWTEPPAESPSVEVEIKEESV